ncbi:MAG TPA: transaldolase [Holosporales bacterium]|nr:MAG: transaldolase [Alphaproteobacteria bacterium GWB1_45_5]HCI49025.1 transaldolase [Holosporales bacterium]
MDFKIKIFADGANLEDIKQLYKLPYIKGFTTNPTLMRKAGIKSYEQFSKELLSMVKDLPVSLEVFADDAESILYQAQKIASWGKNVYVKIPVSTTHGEFLGPVMKTLSGEGIPLNITALMTADQVKATLDCLSKDTPSIISVFAGRIADTGRDSLEIMIQCKNLIKESGKKAELLWASPRELYNVIQADQMGCDIITVDKSILDKLPLLGKDLLEYSKETVQMFYKDAMASAFQI